MAYDRHMNLVLGDAEEFRKLPPKKGAKEEVREQCLAHTSLCNPLVRLRWPADLSNPHCMPVLAG